MGAFWLSQDLIDGALWILFWISLCLFMRLFHWICILGFSGLRFFCLWDFAYLCSFDGYFCSYRCTVVRWLLDFKHSWGVVLISWPPGRTLSYDIFAKGVADLLSRPLKISFGIVF